MKYLMKYEDLSEIYKLGDYVVFDINVDDNNKIVIRANHPYEIINLSKDNKTFYPQAGFSCDLGYIIYFKFNDKNARKISKKEVEFLLDAEKYNL